MVTSRRLTRRTWASRQNYRSRLLAIGKIVMVSGFGHLAWDSTEEKNGSKKKTEQQSSGSSQLRNETEANKRSNRKERNNTVNTQA